MEDPYSICVLRSGGTYFLLAYRCFLDKSGSNYNSTNHIYCFFFILFGYFMYNELQLRCIDSYVSK